MPEKGTAKKMKMQLQREKDYPASLYIAMYGSKGVVFAEPGL